MSSLYWEILRKRTPNPKKPHSDSANSRDIKVMLPAGIERLGYVKPCAKNRIPKNNERNANRRRLFFKWAVGLFSNGPSENFTVVNVEFKASSLKQRFVSKFIERLLYKRTANPKNPLKDNANSRGMCNGYPVEKMFAEKMTT
ncbi:MAG: hypothetical protein K2P51_05715 [Rhabdochlamydiaceae bacterium]|nr:hypothetical protein [Rhabdochlamydiaceae bacterium]